MEMATNVDAVLEAIKQLSIRLEKHMDDEEKHIKGLRNDFLNAFPDQDPAGHLTAHQLWIAETKRKAEFWEKMKFELTRWGLMGFIAWVVIQLWLSFLKGPTP